MKNDLDTAIGEFESEINENKVIRKELINNLRQVIANPEMQITPYDKAMSIQSKLMIFKTLDDLVKSNEDITIKKIKLKLARKSDEAAGMVGATIVSMLKEIRAIGEPTEGGKPVPSPEEAKKALTARVEELQKSTDPKVVKQVTVSEGELEACGAGMEAEQPDRPEDEVEEE